MPDAIQKAPTNNAPARPTTRSASIEWWKPETLDQAKEIAELFATSGLVPNDYAGKAAKCLVAMIFGGELGLPPLAAMQSIQVVNGRPSLYGDAIPALVKTSPGSDLEEEPIRDQAGETIGWRCKAVRRGCADVVREYTKADAQRAGLWGKDNWKKYPARMLQMRARSWAARDQFADVLTGLAVFEDHVDVEKAATFTVVPSSSSSSTENLPLEVSTSDQAGEVELPPAPREPKTWTQKVEPKRAKAGDFWVAKDTGKKSHLVEGEKGLAWVAILTATEVDREVERLELRGTQALEEPAQELAEESPAATPTEESTAEPQAEPQEPSALDLLRGAAKDAGLDAAGVAEVATKELGRPIFSSSDLEGEEFVQVRQAIERGGSSS